MIERRPAVPRVSVPGVDPEAVERLQAALAAHDDFVEHLKREKRGLADAFFRLGRRTSRKPKPRRRATKHVRHMERVAVRSAYLKA